MRRRVALQSYFLFSPTEGVFVGYSRDIRGVFICIGYVSVMCRLCIGYATEHTGSEGGRFINNENNDNNCSILPKLADE